MSEMFSKIFRTVEKKRKDKSYYRSPKRNDLDLNILSLVLIGDMSLTTVKQSSTT